MSVYKTLVFFTCYAAAGVAVKSLQSCLTLQPHRQQPTRLLCPWDSPDKITESGLPFPSPMNESEK